MKTERQVRMELAQVCRWMYEKNLISSTDGNVSCKMGQNRMLITPSGVNKGFLKPEDLIVTDLSGKKLSGTKNPSQEISMHVKAYAVRGDIGAIVHAHPIHCIAFTLAGKSLGDDYLPEVVLSVGKIPIVPYTTPTTEEVGSGIEDFIQKHDALILDRHGALTLGKDLIDAFNKLERMEHVAHVMYVAHQLGPLKRLRDDELQKLHQLLSA